MSKWFREHLHLYPENWNEVADRIKDLAGWRCESCSSPSVPGRILTVHHAVVSDPAECSDWNLAALCQVCHLRAHALRPLPATKEECIWRLRLRHEIEIGQLCLPLRIVMSGTRQPVAHVARRQVEHPEVQGDQLVMPWMFEILELAQLSLPLLLEELAV